MFSILLRLSFYGNIEMDITIARFPEYDFEYDYSVEYKPYHNAITKYDCNCF